MNLSKKKKNFNAKLTKTEGKTASLTGFAATAALNAVENKITSISNLVKKTDYDSKISGIKAKYFGQI